MLAWKLNYSAIQMCQTLGYHRLPSAGDTSEGDLHLLSKSNLFWYSYILDKGLALKLGRQSAVQDYDLVIPTPANLSHASKPWQQLFVIWVWGAQVQGKILESLYRCTATSTSHDQRKQQGLAVAQEIQSLLHITEGLVANSATTDQAARSRLMHVGPLELSLRAELVSLHAILCLVYRGIPTPTGSSSILSPDCIRSARSATREHLTCMRLIGSNISAQAGYILW